MFTPLIKVIVPSVASIGDTRTFAIKSPFNNPVNMPTATPPSTTIGRYTTDGGKLTAIHAITNAQALVTGMIDKLMPPSAW